MKKTIKKRTQAVKPEATTQPAAPRTNSHESGPCPPDIVLEEALKEANRRPLKEHHNAIRVLREQKRFTFREIAEWLKGYNIEADHNAVYREYTRGMPDDQAQDVALADEHTEEKERGF